MKTDTEECTCCGRTKSRRTLHALGSEPKAYICRRCGLWVAVRLVRDRSQER